MDATCVQVQLAALLLGREIFLATRKGCTVSEAACPDVPAKCQFTLIVRRLPNLLVVTSEQ